MYRPVYNILSMYFLYLFPRSCAHRPKIIYSVNSPWHVFILKRTIYYRHAQVTKVPEQFRHLKKLKYITKFIRLWEVQSRTKKDWTYYCHRRRFFSIFFSMLCANGNNLNIQHCRYVKPPSFNLCWTNVMQDHLVIDNFLQGTCSSSSKREEFDQEKQKVDMSFFHILSEGNITALINSLI